MEQKAFTGLECTPFNFATMSHLFLDKITSSLTEYFNHQKFLIFEIRSIFEVNV